MPTGRLSSKEASHSVRRYFLRSTQRARKAAARENSALAAGCQAECWDRFNPLRRGDTGGANFHEGGTETGRKGPGGGDRAGGVGGTGGEARQRQDASCGGW